MNTNVSEKSAMACAGADEGERGYPAVAAIFPGHREVLKRLFTTDQSFRSLCDEYEACLAALNHWRESNLPEAPRFRNEFSSLLGELEEEMEECLNRAISD